MKTFNYILSLCCLLVAAGCTREEPGGETTAKEIRIAIDGIASGDDATRAAVDEWSDTPVSIAYAYGSSALFDRALAVTVAGGDGKHIQTGMEYPLDGITPVSFVGYHPAKAPNEQGIVGYDLSAGDQDVMLSNLLSGTQTAPITGAMRFEHQLTRFTFQMKCKTVDDSYPETIHGVRATGTSMANRLMTYAHINLNTRLLNFSFPGQVTSSLPDGAVVPSYNASDDALTFDLMLQPGVPVDFEVITLTDIKPLTITSGNTLWDQLLGGGSVAGKHYTIKLEFSGEGILADGISITRWDPVVTAHGAGIWW